jgi:hypothetical protein
LYYADESGFDEYYSREHGYAPRGEKVIGTVSGGHFGRTSIVAAKMGKETVAAFAFGGSMDGMLFEGWLDCVFVPALKNPLKSVLILDNAPYAPVQFFSRGPLSCFSLASTIVHEFHVDPHYSDALDILIFSGVLALSNSLSNCLLVSLGNFVFSGKAR